MLELQTILEQSEKTTYCHIIEEHDGVDGDKCLIIQHFR